MNGRYDTLYAIEHLEVSFSRSGGPGGQNVNKVNTKVDMRFTIKTADWLPTAVKAKLREQVCFLVKSVIVRHIRQNSRSLCRAEPEQDKQKDGICREL